MKKPVLLTILEQKANPHSVFCANSYEVYKYLKEYCEQENCGSLSLEEVLSTLDDSFLLSNGAFIYISSFEFSSFCENQMKIFTLQQRKINRLYWTEILQENPDTFFKASSELYMFAIDYSQESIGEKGFHVGEAKFGDLYLYYCFFRVDIDEYYVMLTDLDTAKVIASYL